jgi:predicted deacylase
MLSLRQMQFVNMLVHGREIERRASEAARPPGGRLRRQRQAEPITIVSHNRFPSRSRASGATSMSNHSERERLSKDLVVEDLHCGQTALRHQIF